MNNMPWCVKIETTEGCNRSCHFCPIPTIYGKKYKFLTPEIALKIADQLNEWEPKRYWRFELAMFGEPTMNKQLPAILSNLKTLNKCQITVLTNGDILKSHILNEDEKFLTNLYIAGANVIGVDCYDDEALEFFHGYTPPKGVSKYRYFEDKYPFYARKSDGYKINDMVIIDDIIRKQDVHTVRKLHNFGGNVDNSIYGVEPLKEPIKAGCEKPFRDLVITHTGDVIICCLDAAKTTVVGNIYKETLKDIWFGDMFMDIRLSLSKADRSLVPCDKCSYFGGHKRFLAVSDFKENLNILENKKLLKNDRGILPTM